IRDPAFAQERRDEIGVPLHRERATRLRCFAESRQVEADDPAAQPRDEGDVDAASHPDAVQEHDRTGTRAEVLVDELRAAAGALPEIDTAPFRGEQTFRHPTRLPGRGSRPCPGPDEAPGARTRPPGPDEAPGARGRVPTSGPSEPAPASQHGG